AAAAWTRQVQRFRPRSLRWPNKGLLIIEARKMALRATPVSFTEKPWAPCRNNEPRLPMLLPAKSRMLKAKAAATKHQPACAVLNNLARGLGLKLASDCAG